MTRRKKPKPLTRKMSARQAFRHLLWQGAAAHDAQIPAILGSDDPEAVHRARVALRRLRSALRGFADMLSPEIADRLEGILAERFRRLGPLRDADVRAAALAGTPAGPEAAGEAARLRAALRSELRGFGPLSDELAQLLESAKLSPGGRRKRLARAPVGVVASRALQAAWTELLAFGRHLDRLSGDELHGFRKRAKDMRYLAGFFGPLWLARSEAPMLRRMARMQDALGLLNDLATMRRNAGDPAAHLPPDAAARERAAWRDAEAAWARLRRMTPWWCAPPH